MFQVLQCRKTSDLYSVSSEFQIMSNQTMRLGKKEETAAMYYLALLFYALTQQIAIWYFSGFYHSHNMLLGGVRY